MPSAPGRDVGELLTDIAHNLENLVRSHVRLEAASVFESASAMARGIAWVAAGAMLSLLTTLLLLLGAVARLSDVMRPWEAFVLVSAGAGLLSFVLTVAGVRALRGRAATTRFVVSPLEGAPWPTPPLT
jgi:hypothetical protein